MIYIIHTDNKCKIGYSKHPDKRLKELQTGNSEILRILHITEGDKTKEKELHKKFEHLNICGEWFNYTKEIKDYFNIIEHQHTYFSNSLFKLTGSMKSKVDFQLFIYLCSTASKSGMIYTSKEFYEKFNNANIKNGAESITRTTFQTSIKNLTDSKILVKTGKGEYQLNPFFIWKDSIEKRKEITTEIYKLPEEEKQKFLLEELNPSYK